LTQEKQRRPRKKKNEPGGGGGKKSCGGKRTSQGGLIVEESGFQQNPKRKNGGKKHDILGDGVKRNPTKKARCNSRKKKKGGANQTRACIRTQKHDLKPTNPTTTLTGFKKGGTPNKVPNNGPHQLGNKPHGAKGDKKMGLWTREINKNHKGGREEMHRFCHTEKKGEPIP